jgi:hypothetical protein
MGLGLRVLVIFAVASAIVFASLYAFFRAQRRERLAEEWRARQPPLPEHTYVANGLRDYEAGLRLRLGLGVVILPGLAIAIILAIWS